jgi:hypothetical protein
VEDSACEETVRLSRALESAIQEWSEAKDHEDRAFRENVDPGSYGHAVTAAQRAVRVAEKALNQHRKEHGC